MDDARYRLVFALGLLALLSLGSAPATAQSWWWPPSMTVPDCPTTGAAVLITVWGDYPNSCIPNGSAVSVTGQLIQFDVILDYPPGVYCLQVITPWSLSEPVGPLAAGTYSVYARLFHTFFGELEPPTLLGVFTVYDTTHLGDLNCDGVVDAFDIDPFVLALTDPAGYQSAYPTCNIDNADCNDDGDVNGFDIDPFVLLLTGG